jgi:hypothetical protein
MALIIFDGPAVDQRPGSAPLVTLVVDESLFVGYFSCPIYYVLMLDVHWGEEQVRDELCFSQGEGDAITVFDIFSTSVCRGTGLLVVPL